MRTTTEKVIGHATLAALFAAAMFLGGYTLMLFWAWFVLPVFAVVPLSYGQAFGLRFLVGWLQMRPTELTKTDSDGASETSLYRWSVVIAAQFLTLGVGYIIHLCVAP